MSPARLQLEKRRAARRVEAACREALLTPEQAVQALVRLHFRGEEEALRYIREHGIAPQTAAQDRTLTL